LLHAPPEGGIREIAAELLHVEAERGSHFEKHAFVERQLVSVDRIVHFPESTLAVRRLRPDGHELGAGVRALVREMAEDIGHPVPEGMAQAVEHVPQAPAVGAEVVAVDEDRKAIIAAITATDVIPRTIDRANQTTLVGLCAHAVPSSSRVTLHELLGIQAPCKKSRRTRATSPGNRRCSA